jgi:hypothetical protein
MPMSAPELARWMAMAVQTLQPNGVEVDTWSAADTPQATVIELTLTNGQRFTLAVS